MAALPSDNMSDIFSRIPVESLARFRCVSKLWRHDINDPYLETMHAKLASYDPLLVMLHQSISDDNPGNSLCVLKVLEYKEQEEEEEGFCMFEVRKKPLSMNFICENSVSRYPKDIILGSCNGLLYSSRRADHLGCDSLFVIHPLKQEYYELPPINISLGFDASYGLGFDYSTNAFKMVSVMRKEKVRSCTMIHVLGTDSWRKIPQVPLYHITGEGVFADGCLHWLSISFEDDDEYPAYLGRPVIRFDLAKEEFVLINPPHEELPSGCVKEHLVDLNGEVGYVYNIVNLYTEAWVLKKSGWVKHCAFEHTQPLPLGVIKVLGFWNEKGDVLMTDNRKHMFVYTLKSQTLYEVNFGGCDGEEESAKDIRLYQNSLSSTRYTIKK